MRNLANWTLVCPRRNLVHPAPENNNALVLRYSADPLKAVSSQQVIPSPQAILKIRPPNSLDYRVRYEPQTCSNLFNFQIVVIQMKANFYIGQIHIKTHHCVLG